MEKKEVLKRIFSENGIVVQEEDRLGIDSLVFLTIIVSIEEQLQIEIKEDSRLFELDYKDFSFEEFCECI